MSVRNRIRKQLSITKSLEVYLKKVWPIWGALEYINLWGPCMSISAPVAMSLMGILRGSPVRTVRLKCVGRMPTRQPAGRWRYFEAV